jgi:molybdopterin molybdotransferase
MISIAKAIQIVEQNAPKIGVEQVSIDMAAGRILAEDIVADMDLPPFDRSQMDGFAVRAEDVKNAPAELRIVGESAAGGGWHRELKKGEAVRIMTGAPVPIGADTVQKVELTSEGNFASDAAQRQDGTITIFEPIDAGKNIVRRAAETKKGERIFEAGEYISERMIATLAAFGYSQVTVSVQPRVAILTTGSEVVEIDRIPGIDQIRNSNSAMLQALAESAGGIAKLLPSTSDELEAIKKVIAEAAENANITVVTGGVSVGKYDLTKTALKELGAEIFFDRIRLKPGKPAVFARIDEKLIFGLPGNPVSAAVTFYLFVRKALLSMQGALTTDLRGGRAIAGAKLKAARERDTYLPAKLSTDDKARLVVAPVKWIGSSDFIGFARADALAFIPAGKQIETGEITEILLL